MIVMGNVFDETLEVVRTHRRGWAAGILAIFLALAVRYVFDPQLTVPAGVRIGFQVIGLVCSLVLLWGYAVILAGAINPTAGGAMARVVAMRRYPAVLGTAVLLVIAFAVLMVPLILVLAAGGLHFDTTGSGQADLSGITPGVAVFTFLYLLALLVALVWIGSRLVLVYAVAVAERRGLGVFARSWRLTYGIAWKVIGVSVLFVIVSGISVLAARFVIGSVLRILLGGGDHPITVASVITALCCAVVMTVWLVIAAAFVGRLYVAARNRVEAHAVPL